MKNFPEFYFRMLRINKKSFVDVEVLFIVHSAFSPGLLHMTEAVFKAVKVKVHFSQHVEAES